MFKKATFQKMFLASLTKDDEQSTSQNIASYRPLEQLGVGKEVNSLSLKFSYKQFEIKVKLN